MSVSFIRDYGPKLVENGYKLCAVAPGAKRPLGKAWQNNPLTAQACRQHPADEGVGIICGYEGAPVCAVDVDFYGTEAESRRLYELLCRSKLSTAGAVYRVGRPGKFLLLFRAKGVWTKGTTRGFARPGQPKPSKIEIMGRGQQVVVYGIHEETKKPYSYPLGDFSGTPLTKPYNQLPEISLDEIDAFKSIFETYVQSIGFKLVEDKAAVAVSASAWDMEDIGAFRTVGLSIDEIRNIFDKTPCDWD
ncbi:MAG: bifunctional DNA primase/polymerase, partial [Duodenibacillus sp.]